MCRAERTKHSVTWIKAKSNYQEIEKEREGNVHF